VRFPIRLEALALEHPKVAQYEPEISPGLTYHMDCPKVTVLVYVSGKIAISGAKVSMSLLESNNCPSPTSEANAAGIV